MLNTMTNILLFFLLIGSLTGAVWLWAKDQLLKEQAEDIAKDAREDADIANEPNKSKPDLLRWLRGK